MLQWVAYPGKLNILEKVLGLSLQGWDGALPRPQMWLFPKFSDTLEMLRTTGQAARALLGSRLF